MCRILQSETQTDQQVQSKLFPPVGVLPCPSFSILLLGLFTVATGMLEGQVTGSVWTKIKLQNIERLRDCKSANKTQDCHKKQYFVATHPYEQREEMMKHVFVNGCDQVNGTEDPNSSVQVNVPFQESVCKVWMSSLLERLVFSKVTQRMQATL